MNNVDKAVGCFEKGFNCAQAILSTYGDQPGLGRGEALRLAAAFGSGVARSGHICGAVSGSLMVIGLRYAKGMESKERLLAAAREFMKRFEERSGSVMCKDLLGCDLRAPFRMGHRAGCGDFDPEQGATSAV